MHQEQTIFTRHFWEICLLDFVIFVMAEEEALASFCISLPSGQSTTISLPASSTVAALKEAAQEAFQQGWLRLATADGRLLDPQTKSIKSRVVVLSISLLNLFYFRFNVCIAGTVFAMYGDYWGLVCGHTGAYVCLTAMFSFCWLLKREGMEVLLAQFNKLIKRKTCRISEGYVGMLI